MQVRRFQETPYPFEHHEIIQVISVHIFFYLSVRGLTDPEQVPHSSSGGDKSQCSRACLSQDYLSKLVTLPEEMLYKQSVMCEPNKEMQTPPLTPPATPPMSSSTFY